MDFSSFIPLIVVVLIVICYRLVIAPFIENAITKKQSSATMPRADKKLAALEAYPYVNCGSILTPTELKFFNDLKPVIKGDWHIFTKVRLEDIINVKSGLDKKVAYGSRGRIKSRHIDFVLCEKDTLNILMCIELDDRSHERKDRVERDTFVNKAVRDAGLTIVRIPVRHSYGEAYLRKHLFEPDHKPKATAPVTPQVMTARKLEVVESTGDDLNVSWKSPTNV